MHKPAFWVKWLPPKLRARVEHRSNLQKILGNTGWLFFDKILRMAAGLLVGVWVARYLGPEQFGLFSYATAIVALFTAVATLGLNGIVVRDLVRDPGGENATMGTAFAMQFLGGFVAFTCAVAAVSLMRPEDMLARTMVAIIGSALIFKSTDVARYWFESKVGSKYTVLAENLAFIIFAAIKVWLIVEEASLIAFVWAVLAESILAALLLIAIYQQQTIGLRKWTYDGQRAKSLLKDSWPLILSGLAAMLYMRIDQIMLGEMLNDKAVGIYSAAVRLSEVWYFIPMTIVASVFPAIIESRERSQALYKQRLVKLFELLAVLAISLALPITFMSEWIMRLLYGEGFSDSAKILVIHIWGSLFVFLGVGSSRWFIVENLQKFTFYRTLAGCVINILLNLILIPVWGPIGSACASVASQAVASVFFNAISQKTRPVFNMQIRAMTGVSFVERLHAKK